MARGQYPVYELRPLTAANIRQLEPLYKEFCKVAQVEYGWPLAAVEFSGLQRIIAMGLMHGYILRDVPANKAVGFMFYQVEAHRALEIKVLYLDDNVSVKTAVGVVFDRFMEDIKVMPNWDVMSYPLLGTKQKDYVEVLPWYGMKPVGQAVVKFYLSNAVSVEVFRKQEFPALPDGYRLASYTDADEVGVATVLTEAFADSVDALWDPRFRSYQGVLDALAFVRSGGYGVFWPASTMVLHNAEDTVVGVSLLNVVSAEEGNIPLIGLLQSERKHKLGRTLLAATVDACLSEVVKGKFAIESISATVATGNIPAVKMYRHTGFQEDHWYPHVYQDQSSVLTRKAKQWC